MHKDTLECTLLTDKAELSLDLECSAEVLHILCSLGVSILVLQDYVEMKMFFFIITTLAYPKFLLLKHIVCLEVVMWFGVAVYWKLFLLIKNQ